MQKQSTGSGRWPYPLQMLVFSPQLLVVGWWFAGFWYFLTISKPLWFWSVWRWLQMSLRCIWCSSLVCFLTMLLTVLYFLRCSSFPVHLVVLYSLRFTLISLKVSSDSQFSLFFLCRLAFRMHSSAIYLLLVHTSFISFVEETAVPWDYIKKFSEFIKVFPSWSCRFSFCVVGL